MAEEKQIVGSPFRSSRLRMRRDLQVSQQVYLGQKFWAVGDPVSLEFYRFNEQEYSLLKWCDGLRSLDDIKNLFESTFSPHRIKHSELQKFLVDLHKKSLVSSTARDRGRHLYQISKKKKLQKMAKQAASILAIRWKGIDPTRVLDFLTPCFSWFFSKVATVINIALMLSALLLVLTHYEEFSSRLPSVSQFFGSHNWLGLVCVIAGTKIVHELAHGVACRRHGGLCHELGIMFLVFIPTLFVNTSDTWRFQNKWSRAIVGLAGIYVELFLATLATYLWWFTGPGPWEFIFLNIMMTCTVSTVLFNGNPLLRFDGYFVLCDLVEIPNLGERSGKFIRNLFLTYFLGVRETDEFRTPQSTKNWLAFYCLSSFVYKAMIAYLIAIMVLKMSRPFGLESVAMWFSIFVAVGFFLAPLFALGKFFWIPGRIERIKQRKALLTCSFLLMFAFLFFLVPLPHYISGQFTVETIDNVTLYQNTMH